MSKNRQTTVDFDPLDKYAWAIFGYCRENFHSPDSKKHSKRITDLLRAAVAAVTVQDVEEIRKLCEEVSQLKAAASEESDQKKKEMTEVRWLGWLETKNGGEVANRVRRNCRTDRPARVAFFAGANWRQDHAEKSET